jgi:hypothetical protein
MDVELPVSVFDLLSWVGLGAGVVAFLSAGFSALFARTPTDGGTPMESIRGERRHRADAGDDAPLAG